MPRLPRYLFLGAVFASALFSTHVWALRAELGAQDEIEDEGEGDDEDALLKAIQLSMQPLDHTDAGCSSQADSTKEERQDAEYVDGDQKPADEWTCEHCTFLNPLAESNCQMCNLPRYRDDSNLPDRQTKVGLLIN